MEEERGSKKEGWKKEEIERKAGRKGGRGEREKKGKKEERED